MKLTREPFVPTQFQLASIASRMIPQRVHPTWEPYLTKRQSSSETEMYVSEEEEEMYLGEM